MSHNSFDDMEEVRGSDVEEEEMIVVHLNKDVEVVVETVGDTVEPGPEEEGDGGEEKVADGEKKLENKGEQEDVSDEKEEAVTKNNNSCEENNNEDEKDESKNDLDCDDMKDEKEESEDDLDSDDGKDDKEEKVEKRGRKKKDYPGWIDMNGGKMQCIACMGVKGPVDRKNIGQHERVYHIEAKFKCDLCKKV